MPLSARHYQPDYALPLTIARIAAVIVGLSLSIALCYANYETNKNVSGYLDRAQVAADSDRMHSYLERLSEEMKKYGMDEGHAAFFFKTPQNDMGAMFQVIEDLREKRLPATIKMNHNSPEYQVALDDIRGICRELEINQYALSFRLRHDLIELMSVSLAFVIIGGIAYLIAVLYEKASIVEILPIALVAALVFTGLS